MFIHYAGPTKTRCISTTVFYSEWDIVASVWHRVAASNRVRGWNHENESWLMTIEVRNGGDTIVGGGRSRGETDVQLLQKHHVRLAFQEIGRLKKSRYTFVH